MSGNLVHPWSWVSWQVRAEIRLTRKTLPKKDRDERGGWGGGQTERAVLQQTLSVCLKFGKHEQQLTRLTTVLISLFFFYCRPQRNTCRPLVATALPDWLTACAATISSSSRPVSSSAPASKVTAPSTEAV